MTDKMVFVCWSTGRESGCKSCCNSLQ